MGWHDAVLLQLVSEDCDQVFAEHFNDAEQFLIYSRQQDFDLDVCMGLCDTIETLNASTAETRSDMLSAQFDFKTKLQHFDALFPVRTMEKIKNLKYAVNNPNGSKNSSESSKINDA
ncbi:unnamed protein product [Kluyveromyces dobzhanskii CBS 2104]|uniref:WGS project CCBQ000000000 data, contig 00099 n=1 Tax=Kluyveromyces dobzhanskii CBS 2104 TaxID=1427455 RepID=A0A0A8L3W1_9SACH|nr:unnamed protein product [Kluyveromyces dobzhanskii CBS 2104]